MKKITITILSFYLVNLSFAQSSHHPINFPPGNASSDQRMFLPNTDGVSSNTSSFKRIDNIGVNMFTGTPMINFSLTQVKGDNLNLDIGLSYNGEGVKVNEVPGWAGLSWNLDGEYQIIRNVNDLPDEWYNLRNRPFNLNLDIGYLFSSKSQLDNNNWNQSEFLSESFGSNLWSAAVSNASNAQKLIVDSEPDEFIFNLPGGISGSFYRSEKAGADGVSGWSVKSKSNVKINVAHEMHVMGYNTPSDTTYYRIPLNIWQAATPCRIPSLFTKFIISTPDGFSYTFGGVNEAIEISRGLLIPTQVLNSRDFNSQYTANSWKLTQIKAPDGEVMNFSYERGKVQFTRTKDFVNGVNQTSHNVSSVLDYGINIVYPTYLSTIESSRQIVSFKKSQAVEKWYSPLISSPQGCRLSYKAWPDGSYFGQTSVIYGFTNADFSKLALEFDKQLDYALMYVYAPIINNNPAQNLPNYNQQLDSIIIFDKLSNTNSFGFKLIHSADATVRRTLEGFYKFNFVDTEQDMKHEFVYHNIGALPDFNTLSRDYWGFPKPPITENFACEMEFNNLPDFSPNTPLNGYLKSIKKPLGGSTELVYENNAYGQKIKVNVSGNNVGLEQTSATGPGFRLKKIIDKDYFGAPEIIKEYKYVANYPNSNLSSGILNFDHIDYEWLKVETCEPGVPYYMLRNYSTMNHQQFTKLFKGGIVNYSEVAEVMPDGSYTIYKYTNADDPQYRDEIHAGYGQFGVLESTNFRLSVCDLDRGKIYNIKTFDNNHQLKKEQTYSFENNPARKNEFVKAISSLTLQSIAALCSYQSNAYNITIGIPNHRAWAYKIYTYKNPLSKTIEKTYSEDGAVAFTQEKNFNYDAYGNLVLATETTSEGKILTKATKYNSHTDYAATTVSGPEALGLKLLNTLGIKNYPVEQLVYSNQQVVPPNTIDVSQLLSGTEYVYKSNKPLLDKEYALELSAPIQGLYDPIAAPDGIRTSKINGSGNWEQDSRFVLQKSYPDYTAQAFANKPKTITVKEANEALLWDYSGKYPVASFQNAVAGEVAYTGFEGDYNGANAEFKNGWQFNGTNFQILNTRIGKGALLVSPSITLDPNNTFITSTIALQSGRKYRLSFWAPSGNDIKYYREYAGSMVQIQPTKVGVDEFSYFETEFTAQGTGSVSLLCHRIPPPVGPAIMAMVDEVALFPVGTLFKSMSFDAATGQVLSVNDGTGHLELYEYDAFGRWIRGKDENGHLLTEREYKIQAAY